MYRVDGYTVSVGYLNHGGMCSDYVVLPGNTFEVGSILCEV